MIHTSKQLKDKVRNISKGDNEIAMALLRTYMMERFLESVAVSAYRDNFILKGGMLVASIVGSNMRATMDIDTTVKALPLNAADTRRIVEDICSIPLEDNVIFHITSVKEIMEDFDYPGIRIMLEGALDRMRQPIKIDISTDDVITPDAIRYEYKMMFEHRNISVLSYNLETLLAEKMQTILARGIANTRMRDYYDVYELLKFNKEQIDEGVLRAAFSATCKKRDTLFAKTEITALIQMINSDTGLQEMWNRFRCNNYFVKDIEWNELKEFVFAEMERILSCNNGKQKGK